MFDNVHFDPQIKKYEITISPFLFQMHIEGRFEIESDYEIPPQTIFTKIQFPNQQISDIELIPDKNENCRSWTGRCRVFKIKAFLILSQDKFFSREVDEYEKIPIKISFELKTSNWSLFKYRNDIPHAHDRKYINFINRLKLIELNNHFNYKNSFSITREKYESSQKQLDIPIMWKINDYSYPQTITTKVNFHINNHDEIIYSPIRELFSLENKNNFEIKTHKSQIFLPIKGEMDMSPPEKRTINNRVLFYLKEGISKEKNGTYEINPEKKEIFISEKTSGFLKHRLFMKINNHGIYINIKNHYSFAKDTNLGFKKSARLKIKSKDDNHFKNLHKFKFINI